ncbi:NF-kappa-B inhibitor zeta-like isoform X2 [Megalops cyprinoides]|uniref:NF-kappa-B inhibitor zeta-like isoform X2 n=1 Tax=Megalops cyprinoides TaxID=118141 RepID=UPI0018648B77|nr:NF-kappa-B inhibitor zeta-like isoform X2 [Megalops cyprinoides]
MIIDRVIPDEFAGVSDRDAEVMTSPLNFCAFYGSSPPRNEPVSFSGDRSPWSPSSDSDSGKSWKSASSPSQTSNNLNSMNGDTYTGSARQQRYQGVRVKNPVKELIMQKRNGQLSLHPNHDNKQVPAHIEATDHCPALTAVLLGGKRPSDYALPDPPCAKRPAPLFNNNFLTSHSHGSGDGAVVAHSSDPDLDIADIILQMRDYAPISITTVQVQETPSQAVPPCSTPPSQPVPLQVQEVPLYPDFLPEIMSCSPVQPFTPEPSPPPAPAPLLPPSLPPPSGGMSFFQWQVDQEEGKLSGLTPDQLAAGDEDGDTFLHVAVAQGRRALSYVLARKMAQMGLLDVKERNGQTALQVSMAANQHLIVQDLLTLGAQINTSDCWGRSPLHVCAEKGHALTLQAVHRTLQSTGQQINMEAVNYDGLTALHTAVLSHNAVVHELGGMAAPHSPQTQALLQRRKLLGECISTLLLMGASHRAKDHKSGRTPLHMAAEEANVELLRLFLDQPDSLSIVNAKAYNGNTALHVVSALQGRVAQVDAVKLLMRRGADPSTKNLENEQPTQLVPEGPMGDQVRRILKGRGVQARSCLP